MIVVNKCTCALIPELSARVAAINQSRVQSS